MAAAVYPDRTDGGRLPEFHGEESTVPDVIRDRRDGSIRFEGVYAPLNASNGAAFLAAAHSDQLQHCNLDGIDLHQRGVSLDNGDLTGCSAKGTKFPESLSGCVLKDIEVDDRTDIGSTDFMSCRLDHATWEKLSRLPSAKTAKNLRPPRVK